MAHPPRYAGRTTTIAGRQVPIERGELITIRFSGGAQGVQDAGVYAFWTIFNGEKVDTARWRQGDDPGERWRKMEHAKDYEEGWKIASTAKWMRPATEERVIKWLNAKPHMRDAAFAQDVEITDDQGGCKITHVLPTAHGYQLGC